MRNTKKVISILLTLLMVVGMMSTFAFAASGSSIVVKNAVDGQKYTAYKIFDLEESSKGVIYKISKDSVWLDTVKTSLGDSAFKLSGDYYVLRSSVTDAQAESLTTALESKLKTLEANNTLPANAEVSAPAENGKATITISAGRGYYLVDTSLGALCALVHDNTSREIIEKNGTPSVSKTANADTVTLGQIVEYTITLTAGGKADTEYVLYDKMGGGLELTDDAFVITSNGEPGITSDDYEIDKTATDDYTFKITFKKSYTSAIAKDSIITVTYKAKVVSADSNNLNNEAKMTFGQSESTSNNKLYTGSISLLKYDGLDGTKATTLPGAQFIIWNSDKSEVLRESTVNGKTVYDWVPKGSYKDNGNLIEGIKVITSDNNGKASVSGLKAGIYYFEEITAPSGYKLPTAEDSKYAKVEIGKTLESGKVVGVVNGSIDIANFRGSQLPETGGIGTTIFYLIGAILVIGAGVVFVTRRRMHSDK